MINNLDIIKPLLKFENDNHFYFIQILARKKDIKGMVWNNKVIKDYYIYSLESLEKKMDEIIKICGIFEARAYIRLSRRDSMDIAKSMIVELGEAFRNNSFKHLKDIYASVVGKDTGLDKIRLVDIDDKNQDTIDRIEETIEWCDPNPGDSKLIVVIPTKNGVHLITKPFNLKQFRETYPDVSVHKNNPTLLFIN